MFKKMPDTRKEKRIIIVDKRRKNRSQTRPSIITKNLLYYDRQTKHLPIDVIHVRWYAFLKRL